ncbi:MAG: ABC transporter permease [Candidatus Obscuribacterales bacterium]|nr:ABC transporter permease [Candidatus Obscuribacterales bacterium]
MGLNCEKGVTDYNELMPKVADLTSSKGKPINRASLVSLAGTEFLALWNYRACVPTLVINYLRRRFQRSVLGFIWSLLNPLAMMTIMTLVFSLFFHKNPRDFSLYVFSGLLPWTFMSSTMVAGCGALVEAEGYLKKMPVPKLVFPLVLVGTEFCNFTLSLAALSLLGLIIGLQCQLTMLALPLAIMPTLMFTFGMVVILSVFTVYFRDVAHIVGVALGGIFYLTPILYPVSSIPANLQWWYQFNPFVHFLSLYRSLICTGRMPSLQESCVVWSLSIAATVIGAAIYLWRSPSIIYRL